MNWNLYFDTIVTQEDYNLLSETGVMFELFPLAASCWKDHDRMLADWRDGNWADNG